MLTSPATYVSSDTWAISGRVLTSVQIHWYERLFPLGTNGTIDHASIKDKNTYYTNAGTSMTHIVNGAAGKSRPKSMGIR